MLANNNGERDLYNPEKDKHPSRKKSVVTWLLIAVLATALGRALYNRVHGNNTPPPVGNDKQNEEQADSGNNPVEGDDYSDLDKNLRSDTTIIDINDIDVVSSYSVEVAREFNKIPGVNITPYEVFRIIAAIHHFEIKDNPIDPKTDFIDPVSMITAKAAEAGVPSNIYLVFLPNKDHAFLKVAEEPFNAYKADNMSNDEKDGAAKGALYASYRTNIRNEAIVLPDGTELYFLDLAPETRIGYQLVTFAEIMPIAVIRGGIDECTMEFVDGEESERITPVTIIDYVIMLQEEFANSQNNLPHTMNGPACDESDDEPDMEQPQEEEVLDEPVLVLCPTKQPRMMGI